MEVKKCKVTVRTPTRAMTVGDGASPTTVPLANGTGSSSTKPFPKPFIVYKPFLQSDRG